MLFTLHKRLKVGRVIRVLTFNDITYWGGFDMLQVVFALFVVRHIQAGSDADVGLAFFIYKIFSMGLSIPLGNVFDKLPGMADETYGLALSSIITGMSYMLLSLAEVRWQLFVLMAAIGLSRSLNLNSWRKIFNKSLSKDRSGTELGIYDTIFSLGTALLGLMAGVLSELFGVKLVLVITGMIVTVGALLPVIIRKDIASLS